MAMSTGIVIVVAVVAIAVGILAGYLIRKTVGEKAIGSAEQKAKNLILDAEHESETVKKEKLLEAKEEALKLKNEAEKEIRERRNEISKAENRLVQKEETIDRKLENIERKEQSITQKEQNIINKQKDLDTIISRQLEELERISGYTVDEAKALLLSNIEINSAPRIAEAGKVFWPLASEEELEKLKTMNNDKIKPLPPLNLHTLNAINKRISTK